MKVYMKVILLTFCCFALGGWGNEWNSIYKNYQDIIDSNPTCSYKVSTSDTQLKEWIKFDTVDYSISSSGVKASYDGGGYNVIFGQDGKLHNSTVNGQTIDNTSFSFQSFFSTYKANNSCPSQLYIILQPFDFGHLNYYDYEELENGNLKVNGLKMYHITAEQSVTSGVVLSRTGSTGTGQSDNRDCKEVDSVTCKHYRKVNVPTSQGNKVDINIEIGKKSDGSNYFGISYSSDFTGAIIGHAPDYTITMPNTRDVFKLDDEIFNYVSSDGEYPNAVFISCTSAPENLIFTISHQNLSADNFLSCTTQNNDPEDGNSDESDYNGGAGEVDENDNVLDVGENGGLIDQTQEIKPIVFCEKAGVLQAFKIVGYILFIAKIAIPSILIIMASVDLIRAVISSDDKANKVALSALARRIALGVIIFFIPVLLDFVFSLIDDAANTTSKFSNCTTCLFNPGDCADGYLEQINE